MKKRGYFAFLLCVLALAACETWEGLREDLSTVTSRAGEFASSPGGATSSNTSLLTPCPHVQVIEDLASLNEFTNISQPTGDNLISRVDLVKIGDSCKAGARSMTVDLKLAFEGTLGPRGKMNSTDTPFFTYPYFVAVTAPNGDILAKEVFAASVTYEHGQDRHTHYENLRHIIPMDNLSRSGNYKVLVGFQMSQDQLAYNRAEIKRLQAEAKAREAAEKQAAKQAAAAGQQSGLMTVAPAQGPAPVDITVPVQ